MSHPLDGVHLKLRRAEHHLTKLHREFRNFIDREAHRVSRELDRERGQYVVKWDAVNEEPPNWPVVIGDVLHNLRSALDHLVWQLALQTTAQPHERTEFPIFWEKDKFDDSGRVKIRDLRPEAQAAIEQLQPCAAPDPKAHVLWVLHELNRIDKHRLLHVVGQAVMVPSRSGGPRARLGLQPGDDVTLMLTLEVDTDAARSLSDVEIERQMEDYATVDIVFSQTVVVDGRPVVPILNEIGQHIERVVIPELGRFIR